MNGTAVGIAGYICEFFLIRLAETVAAITKSINKTAAVLIVLLVLMIYVLILIPFVQLRSTKEFYFKKDEFAIKSR